MQELRCALCKKRFEHEQNRDSVFCNFCWWELMNHPFLPEADGSCALDDFPKSDDIHQALNPYREVLH